MQYHYHFRKIVSGTLLASALSFYACGGNSTATQQTSVQDTLSQNPDYQAGLGLVSHNDCFTCHTVSESGTGPSFESIAEKYAADEKNTAFLVSKIQKGGSGSWGAVPMTPHPNLSKADGEKIVRYIFLLKK